MVAEESPTGPPAHGENPLYDRNLAEAKELATFVNSPVWVWFKALLQRVQPRLMAAATAKGLATDERLITLGKLALVSEVLDRPGMLLALLRNHENAVDNQPLPQPPPPAPFQAQMGLL